MDGKSKATLTALVREQRVASLGTLRDGAPQVTLVSIAEAFDFSAFYLHLSRLAFHTQNLLRNPRASLLIVEPDLAKADPQTLARISILGNTEQVDQGDADYDSAKTTYLKKHPRSALQFQLGDFRLYRIVPVRMRYVAGFGRIYDLSPEDLRAASGQV